MNDILLRNYGNKQEQLKITISHGSIMAGIVIDDFKEDTYKLRLKKDGYPVGYINKRCGKMVIRNRKTGIGTDIEYKLTEQEFDKIRDKIESMESLPEIEQTEQVKKCFYR